MELSPPTTACLPLAQMLSSILAETASNITAVSATASRGMEQRAYTDWARQYSSHAAAISHQPAPPRAGQRAVPFSDSRQVSRRAAPAYRALSRIPGDAKEELVVWFGIPRRPGWLDSSSPPFTLCPPCLPRTLASARLTQLPDPLRITEKNVEEAKSEAGSLRA